MVTADREKVVCEYASRRESGDTDTKIFKDNGNRRKDGAKERKLDWEWQNDQAGED